MRKYRLKYINNIRTNKESKFINHTVSVCVYNFPLTLCSYRLARLVRAREIDVFSRSKSSAIKSFLISIWRHVCVRSALCVLKIGMCMCYYLILSFFFFVFRMMNGVQATIQCALSARKRNKSSATA